ncbi:MAG: efflux RND transporter periplasmic adaptor subunit [Ignavibacteriae bacterium]|nr:efflux RND transporter periplasmic adaptor subunit [Ignavibacteriota bacterium]NOG98706.1 efflux RND transporter periplasmic adaptor subunit [Ignavibacteriota bacterium]
MLSKNNSPQKGKNILTIILTVLLVAALGFIVYQNFIAQNNSVHEHESENGKQLYTCGMHPDIISDEPGNCPICEMKLTPIKNEEQDSGEKQVAYWVAPMDPNEIYDSPGKSKMGMDLVPVYENEISGSGVVKIDPVVQQNMNVRLSAIESKILSSSIVTNGVVTSDERSEFLITSRIAGWIEKLYVNFEGQSVSKGEKLLDIYSPELLAAQKEFLSSLRYKESIKNSGNAVLVKSGDELLTNSIKKLELLRMSAGDIESLMESKKVKDYTPLYSPANGIVMKKNIVEGEKIKTGEMLMHISDLSKLWVIADIYEHEISKVKLNSAVKLYPNSFTNKILNGTVSFIYPTLDEKTRTVKVRIDVKNSDLLLKPSMLVRVEIEGKSFDEMPVISEEAVIRSGMKNIAVLALGEGKFKPVEVELGNYSNGYYQVLKGLQPGSKVVSSAQFLIDSESSLKSAIKKFSSAEQPSDDKPMSEDHSDHITGSAENEYGVDSPLIRTGVIDVESIDENGDGKIYQCPMDWNILADEFQRCPVCEMKMKEYTIDEVKINLKKYDYKFKD